MPNDSVHLLSYREHARRSVLGLHGRASMLKDSFAFFGSWKQTQDAESLAAISTSALWSLAIVLVRRI